MENSSALQQKPEKLISKDFILVMISSLGTAFCNVIFFTAMPLYAQTLTGSEVIGGLMMTFYSIAALISRPVTGVLSDGSGRVKLLIIGAAVCTVACALYGVTTALVLLLAIRVVHGFAFGMHSTCAGAAAADVLPKSRLAEGIGYFSLYTTIAQALGPFIALAVVGKGDMKDYQLLFFFTAGLCLMSTVCNSLITYERKRKKQPHETSGTEILSAPAPANEPEQPAVLPKTFLGFEYAVFLPMAVLILLFFCQTAVNTFLAFVAKERGFGNIGLFYTIYAIGLFVSRFAYAKIMDKRGPDVLVIPGILGLVACYFLIPFAHAPLFLYIIAVPMGFASGAVFPSINTMLFLRCSPQRRGTASAAYFAAIDIGFAIGGPALGYIAAAVSYSAIYYVAAGILAAALALYVIAVAEKKKRGCGSSRTA